MERGYLIVPNFYAPKCSRYIKDSNPKRIHAISYNFCNFRCEYCNFFQRRKDATYRDWSDPAAFSQKVDRLLQTGSQFKFTGGEPTLNPYLKRDLQIVREKGGIIYLDSNCSKVDIIEDLLTAGLVDVLGVSLKGLTESEAQKKSCVANAALCWDNVWRAIDAASKTPTEVIVTYVANQDFSYERLMEFAHLLAPYADVYMKINNYQADNGISLNGWEPFDDEELEHTVIQFVQRNPIWYGRVILIRNSQSITNFSKVRLL